MLLSHNNLCFAISFSNSFSKYPFLLKFSFLLAHLVWPPPGFFPFCFPSWCLSFCLERYMHLAKFSSSHRFLLIFEPLTPITSDLLQWNWLKCLVWNQRFMICSRAFEKNFLSFSQVSWSIINSTPFRCFIFLGVKYSSNFWMVTK